MTKHRRQRRRFNRRSKPGTAPGTLTQQHEGGTAINVIAYRPSGIRELHGTSLAVARQLETDYEVIWIDITGLGDIELIREFGRVFGIHDLTLEDVVNVHQRAKFESFDAYDYFVTRMVTLSDDIHSEQLSVFHTGKYVISFQQFPGDCLEPLRERIRKGKGKARNRSSDYLVYAIIDSVLDHYFPIVDWFGEKLEDQDARLMAGDGDFSLAEIHRYRSQLIDLGRWLRPNREMINQLLRDEVSNMSAETRIYMRDCYDHVVQLYETIETYREVCSDLRDFHLSAVSNRTNEVMKTLTIVSTIFIPLSFIAGVYGMNFRKMPELDWNYGYFVILGLMATVGIGFLAWFYSRGWFSR